MRAAADLVGLLVPWYLAHRRELPWRTHPDPYWVLVSELMLQQTRVETVLPYFDRFVTAWPDVGSLAAADEADVLKAWAGLGYYARARNLQAAARQAAALGGLPSTVEGLEALPGVGPYTAGAVASIAFGVATPLVDGNVERVLSRIDARDADPKGTAGRNALWARGRELHAAAGPDVHPGDLNQALMELGATVCTPRTPRCGGCPMSTVCSARQTGDPLRYPTKAPKRAPTPIRGVCGLLWVDGGLVMGRRPPGLLGGLWEPISGPVEGEADPKAVLVSTFVERSGLSVEVTGPLGQVVHVFTHRRLTTDVFAVHGSGAPTAGWYEEVSIVDPASVALSTLTKKILALDRQPPLPFSAGQR